MAGRAALPKVGFMAGCAALLEDRVQGGSHLNMSGLKRVVAIEDLEMERLRCVEVGRRVAPWVRCDVGI